MALQSLYGLLFTLFVLWVGGFLFWRWTRWLMKKRSAEYNEEIRMSKRGVEREMVVDITSQERKSILRGLAAVCIFITFVMVIFVGITAREYWKFAVNGEEVQATVTKGEKHRSSGRRSHTTYTYTLQSVINGVRISDTYNAGKEGGYAVGSTVEAYAARSGKSIDLAIKDIVSNSPFSTIPILLFWVVVGFISIKKWKQVETGSMKIKDLPKKFQRQRLAAMPSQSVEKAYPSSQVTPAGFPTYSIGGTSTPEMEIRDDFPKGT